MHDILNIQLNKTLWSLLCCDSHNGNYAKREPLTIHIVVDSEKMITEIGHRESLWKIQLDCIRKYLTEEQGIKVEITKRKQNKDFKTVATN